MDKKIVAKQAPFDLEAMLRDCIPGGTVCDPQKIADGIREYFASQPAADAGQAVAWIGPHQNAWEALNELRRSVAEIIGADPDTWPDHGNAPLAIAAAIGLREAGLKQRAAPVAPPPVYDKSIVKRLATQMGLIPVAPQPLTDEEITAIYYAELRKRPKGDGKGFHICFARAIASRLGRAGGEAANQAALASEQPKGE